MASALAFGVLGVALLVWAVRAAGASAVLDGARRLGWGLLPILAIGGARHLVRALAWLLSLDRADRPSAAQAFGAYVSGDALGNVTPFGALISEPSKIVLMRASLPAGKAIAALAIENIFYAGTVIAVLVAGTAALLWSFAVPAGVRIAAVTTLAAALAAGATATILMVNRTPVASACARLLVRWGVGRAWIGARLDRIVEIERTVLDVAATHRKRLLPILTLEVLYHAAGVLEIWFALAMITGTPPSLLRAFVLEYVNRTITVAFQFVPMWLGVDEAGTGVAAATLGLGPAAGVTLALVRKARVVTWTFIGLAWLARHGRLPRRGRTAATTSAA